jgi:hypothetical protein
VAACEACGPCHGPHAVFCFPDVLAEPEPEVPNVALCEHIPLSNEASMVTAQDSDNSYSERESPDDEEESHLPLRSPHRKKIVLDSDDEDDAYDGDENRDSDGGPHSI